MSNVDLKDCKTYTISNLSGGLNELMSGFDMEDSQAVQATNMEFSEPGTAKTRPGCSIYAANIGSGTSLKIGMPSSPPELAT